MKDKAREVGDRVNVQIDRFSVARFAGLGFFVN